MKEDRLGTTCYFNERTYAGLTTAARMANITVSKLVERLTETFLQKNAQAIGEADAVLRVDKLDFG